MQTMSEEKTASEGHAEGEAGTRSAELVKRARRQHGIEAVRTIIRFAMDRMRETQLQEVASSMTLTTLLSLVPLIAVAMSAFALFPSFADSRHALEEAIISGVLPQQYTETIVTYLRNFTDHASGLGIFGLAGLAVTALLLIDKFFVTVNRIYQVRRMRPWGQRALLYWALITLGPLVIAFSLTVSTQAIRSASEGVDATSVEWGMAVLQFAIQVASYTFLYKFVPNCHVQLSHAAVGGVSASFAGLAVREAFGTTSRRARSRRSTARSWPSPCSCSGSTSPGSSSSAAQPSRRRSRFSLRGASPTATSAAMTSLRASRS